MTKPARVELNRAALDQVQLGLADGVFDILSQIMYVASGSAPDAPPYDVGLPVQGGAIVYVDRKKVNEATAGGSGPVRKPRGSTGLKVGLVNGVVGFDFPALFNEFGTIHQPARPFFTPAASHVLGSETEIRLSRAMQKRIGGKR